MKQQMYFALVRPHLEFPCAIWDPYTTSDIQELEGIQRRTAWFVAKDYRSLDRGHRYQHSWRTAMAIPRTVKTTGLAFYLCTKYIIKKSPFPFRITFTGRQLKPDSIILSDLESWKQNQMSTNIVIFLTQLPHGTLFHLLCITLRLLNVLKLYQKCVMYICNLPCWIQHVPPVTLVQHVPPVTLARYACMQLLLIIYVDVDVYRKIQTRLFILLLSYLTAYFTGTMGTVPILTYYNTAEVLFFEPCFLLCFLK